MMRTVVFLNVSARFESGCLGVPRFFDDADGDVVLNVSARFIWAYSNMLESKGFADATALT